MNNKNQTEYTYPNNNNINCDQAFNLKNSKIILASASPRRLEILKAHGILPLVIPTNIDESISVDMDKYEAVTFLARKKSLACLDIIQSEDFEYKTKLENFDKNHFSKKSDYIIIASDTVVYTDRILGKPANKHEAYSMIKSIQGKSHEVITGVSIIYSSDKSITSFYDVTKVYCVPMSDDEIMKYISTDEPYDKAGGYAIQGIFGKYIKKIDGDYENVVGLPFYKIKPYLQKL